MRSTAQSELTQVDLAWLIERIRDFQTAYKSTKGKHGDQLGQLLGEVNEIIEKLNTKDSQTSNYDDILKNRNEAFVSLTSVLEDKFTDFITDRLKNKKTIDYATICKEKGHNFHKIVAATLAAIYNDYPEIKRQFGSSADSTAIARGRVQAVFSPLVFEQQAAYKLNSSPRKENNPDANPAKDKEKWLARFSQAQLVQEQKELGQQGKAVGQQALAASVNNATEDLAAKLLDYLKKEAKYFVDKATAENMKPANKRKADYVTEKSTKAALLNTLIKEITPDGKATLSSMQKGINCVLTEERYKPLITSGSLAVGIFGKSGIHKSMISSQTAVNNLLQNKADISDLKLVPSGK